MFGCVGKRLFESISPQIDMPDDFALVGFEGCFTFCIEGGCYGCRIGPALGDGVAKELEDIVVLPPLESAGGILDLTCRIQMQGAAAENGQGSYQDLLHQAPV